MRTQRQLARQVRSVIHSHCYNQSHLEMELVGDGGASGFPTTSNLVPQALLGYSLGGLIYLFVCLESLLEAPPSYVYSSLHC